MEEYWSCRFFSNNNGVLHPMTQFLHKTSKGSLLEVIADNNYEFAVRI
jgi:hypothetical protein